MADKRINQLPALPNLSGEALLPVWDPISDVTYSVRADQINPAQPDRPDQWMIGINYLIGDIVSHDAGAGDQIWITAANNIDSPPSGSNPDWTLSSLSDSGLVAWAPGIFTKPQATVLSNVSGNWRLYILNVAVPFVSSNFATEVTANQWVTSGGGGGGPTTGREYFFRFNSNLFTEQALSFQGIISGLSNSFTARLSAVAYESRLDSVAVFTPHANLAALQSWINSNITGTEASGTRYWIKALATYQPLEIGEAENHFRFTSS